MVETSQKDYGKTLLLFTSGVDSLYTYSCDKNVDLVTIGGMQTNYHRQQETWRSYSKAISTFAKDNGSKHYSVYNTGRVIHKEAALESDLPQSWWILSHSVIMLGSIAPLAFRHNYLDVVISSTMTEEFDGFWGSAPSIDPLVAWGSTRVKHFGFDKSRYDKAELLVESGLQKHILTCPFTHPQCGDCEKCYATMLYMLSLGIDPNSCSWVVYPSTTFDKMKRFLEANRANLCSELWLDFSRRVKAKTVSEVWPGTIEFVNWLLPFIRERFGKLE